MNNQHTIRQARAIELLGLMGSDTEHLVPDGRNVYVPLPFRKDANPNVKVFPDGSYHDFSASPGWSELGLKFYGTLDDLEKAGGSYFKNVWLNRLFPLEGGAKAYAEERKLRAVGLRQEQYHGETVLCFQMFSVDGKMVGIQRRFIGDHTPKNIMFHGSNASESIFMQPGDPDMPNAVYVCEGATDTHTDFLHGKGWLAIGAPSCSSVEGVIKYLLSNVSSESDVVLCFDADEPGQEAQNKVYLAIKDHFPKVYELVHTPGCKDLNDEWTKKGGLVHKLIEQTDPTDIFVKVVDEFPWEDFNQLLERELNFVGFFPADFPGMYHTFYPDPKAKLYIFPESYGRAEVNKLMWKLKKSAYILKGW